MHIRYFIIFLLLFNSSTAFSENNQSLRDINGDGSVSILGFGDSLTYGIGDGGIGDGIASSGGYTSRLENLIGVVVDNEGIPGEEITTTGYLRFPGALRQSNADLVLIMEGVNDASRQISSEQYRNTLQKMINVSNVLGKEALVMTLPPPCCDHGSLAPITNIYSSEVETIALVNEIKSINLKKAWDTTCNNPNQCDLYNLPEGLHPTATGYTVISQTIAASLLGIDIFASNGASELEGALGLPDGTVIVKPDPLTAG